MIVRLNLDLANRSEAFRIELAEICEDPDLLTELSGDQSTRVLSEVGKNSFTKREDQIKLANHPDIGVQCAVVENPTKYPEVIEILLAKSTVVKIALIQSTTDSDILDILARDEDSRVREEVTKNPHTRMKTLFKLAEDPEVSVRLAMAKWSKTKQKIRKKLAQDPNANVRWAIVEREDNTPEDLHNIAMREKNIMVLKAIARSRITAGNTLDELVKMSPDLWLCVSENPNTLEPTLDILATSQSVNVLLAVLKHQNTSDDTICSLKKHQAIFIRNLAYYRSFRRKTS